MIGNVFDPLPITYHPLPIFLRHHHWPDGSTEGKDIDDDRYNDTDNDYDDKITEGLIFWCIHQSRETDIEDIEIVQGSRSVRMPSIGTSMKMPPTQAGVNANTATFVADRISLRELNEGASASMIKATT